MKKHLGPHIIVLLCFGLLTCTIHIASCRASILVQQLETKTTGIFFSGNHYVYMYWHFAGGGPVLELTGDKGEYYRRSAEWRNVEFIELEPDQYRFVMFIRHLGESGKRQGCIRLEPGFKIHFKYTAAPIEFPGAKIPGQLDIVDAKSGGKPDNSVNCVGKGANKRSY